MNVQEPVHEKQKYHLVRYLSEIHSSEDWSTYSETDEVFVRQLPKIELHVHLDGSFDPDYIWKNCIVVEDKQDCDVDGYVPHKNMETMAFFPELFEPPWGGKPLCLRDDVINCKNAREYHNLCTCRGQRSLSYMLNCFQYFLPLVQQQLALIEQLAYDFTKRQFEQNVIYTEVRYSPHLLAVGLNKSATDNSDGSNNKQSCTAEMVVEVVTNGLRRGIGDLAAHPDIQQTIVINQILCAITWQPDWADDVVNLALKFKDNFPCAVVGIDIAAGEEHFDFEHFPSLYQPHYDMCQRAKENDIPLTIHAGESTNTIKNSISGDNVGTMSTNVRRAIEEYGASRIGHGYRSVHDIDLLLYAMGKKIHFEICPTSSVETGGWEFEEDKKDWKQHPAILLYRENGFRNISINSDDPAVFHTSLAWQYRIALAKMKFTKHELVAINMNAVNAAFGLTEQVRTQLLQKLYSFATEHKIHFGSSIDRTFLSNPCKNVKDKAKSDLIPIHCWQWNQQSNLSDRMDLKEMSVVKASLRKAESIDSFFCDRVYTNGSKM
jgi:adenosine deaminase